MSFDSNARLIAGLMVFGCLPPACATDPAVSSGGGQERRPRSGPAIPFQLVEIVPMDRAGMVASGMVRFDDTDGQHNPQESRAVPAFTKFFDMMNAR